MGRISQKTEELSNQRFMKMDWEFNQVVCIAKGGMRVGDVFARIFDVPSSYFIS